MAKRKSVAHVEHSEPVPQSDAEVVATAMAQRVHSCMTRLLEVLARIRRIPSCQREAADFCLQRLRECEGVLLGNAEQFTRTEAVFRLHILRHSLFDSVLMQPSDDEATRGLWTAFVLQLRAVLVAVAKEYGRDVKRLLADRGSEWADLESDARVRDIRAGRVPDPAEHASLFRTEREVNGRSFSIWVALSQEYKAIDAELQRLANEYPETECRQKINELREACEPRLRWAVTTGEEPETFVVATPPADPSSGAKPVNEGELARYSDPLPPLQKRILKTLWNYRFAVQFDTLREEAWEGDKISDSAIKRRLQDIEKRWTEARLDDIDLEISTATASVKLVKPPPKTGDKKGDN
jgi:hypothetical protein